MIVAVSATAADDTMAAALDIADSETGGRQMIRFYSEKDVFL